MLDNIHIQCLETIQNNFLYFISYKCSIPCQPQSLYKQLLNTLNMSSLAVRRDSQIYLILDDCKNWSMVTYCSELLKI